MYGIRCGFQFIDRDSLTDTFDGIPDATLEMLDGLKRFKEFLRQNQNGISYMNEIFAKGKHIYHYAFFVFSDNNEKFYTAKYWHKYETDNSIERIINNFNVDIRDDLSFIE